MFQQGRTDRQGEAVHTVQVQDKPKGHNDSFEVVALPKHLTDIGRSNVQRQIVGIKDIAAIGRKKQELAPFTRSRFTSLP